MVVILWEKDVDGGEARKTIRMAMWLGQKFLENRRRWRIFSGQPPRHPSLLIFALYFHVFLLLYPCRCCSPCYALRSKFSCQPSPLRADLLAPLQDLVLVSFHNPSVSSAVGSGSPMALPKVFPLHIVHIYWSPVLPRQHTSTRELLRAPAEYPPCPRRRHIEHVSGSASAGRRRHSLRSAVNRLLGDMTSEIVNVPLPDRGRIQAPSADNVYCFYVEQVNRRVSF
ncbi:hypothetical protein B0H10DRAFT_12581 [Mycena sp. CBHHK59/15]|nr:hypothetical protein B0H10DRAFT_12581 [Mycena sp. CBHHK59/15]